MIIIGAGRVGGALANAAHARSHPCVLVDRTSGWDHLVGTQGPLLVTVRNDDLDAVVERVPRPRHADLVFIQNGMLRPWLRDHALQDCTRGILFFAVPQRGASITPGGSSPFHGPHAAAMVEFFRELDIPAHEVDTRSFALVELEKLVWNAAFGLLCEVYDQTVGEVIEHHETRVHALLDELLTIGARGLALALNDEDARGLRERLVGYSSSIPQYRGAVKEWRWRNGWFVEVARTHGVPGRTHEDMLRTAGHAPESG